MEHLEQQVDYDDSYAEPKSTTADHTTLGTDTVIPVTGCSDCSSRRDSGVSIRWIRADRSVLWRGNIVLRKPKLTLGLCCTLPLRVLSKSPEECTYLCIIFADHFVV
jgi:hypothetical protein